MKFSNWNFSQWYLNHQKGRLGAMTRIQSINPPKSSLLRFEDDSGCGNERQLEELSQKIENKLTRRMNDAIKASEFNILKALGSLSENPQINSRFNNTVVEVEEGTENLIQCSSSGPRLDQENVNPSLDPDLDSITYDGYNMVTGVPVEKSSAKHKTRPHSTEEPDLQQLLQTVAKLERQQSGNRTPAPKCRKP